MFLNERSLAIMLQEIFLRSPAAIARVKSHERVTTMLRIATITMLGMLATAGCGEGDGSDSTAGTGAVGTGGVAGGGTGGIAGGGTGGIAGGGTGGVAGGGTGGVAGGGTGGMPTAEPIEPTFSAIYDKVFTGCGGPFCHTGTAGGNLMIDTKENTYMALVGVAAMGMNLPNATNPTHCKDAGLMRVVAGDPDASLLYAKVRLDQEVPCGSRMPTGGMLPPEQVEAIKAWIMAGAKND